MRWIFRSEARRRPAACERRLPSGSVRRLPLSALLGAALVSSASTSCGGSADEPAPIAIRFQQHALGCRIPILQAKLQILGLKGFCALDVAENGTVSGICPAVPTGKVRTFRLVYFVEWPSPAGTNVEVQLATILLQVDLTNIKKRQILVDFPQDDLYTDYDDGGGMPNLQRVCAGRSPLGPPGS